MQTNAQSPPLKEHPSFITPKPQIITISPSSQGHVICSPGHPGSSRFAKAPSGLEVPSQTLALVLCKDAAAPLPLKAVIFLHSGPPKGVKFPLQKQSPLNWKRVGPEHQQEPCLIPKGVPGPLKLSTADCSPVLHFPLHSVP